MLSESSKRIVVIKNIPSNFIEEAILILKNDPSLPNNVKEKTEIQSACNKSDDHILKEAQMIISDYMKESKLQAYERRGTSKKAKHQGNKHRKNVIINIILMGSIAFLVFILSRAL
jgi:hypothetical protein